MMNCESEFAVTLALPMDSTKLGAVVVGLLAVISSVTACPRVWDVPPTTAICASSSSDIVVPPAVTWPPGVKVCPEKMICVAEFAVRVESPTVMKGISGVSGVSCKC